MLNLSALFLSPKRLNEVIARPSTFGRVPSDHLQRLRFNAALEDEALAWLSDARLPSLGQLLAEHQLEGATFFTHYGTFFGRGISQSALCFSQSKPLTTVPLLYTKLDEFHSGARLEMQVHPENFTSVSAPGEMSGKKRLFIAGRLTETELPNLRAQLYVVGHLHDEPRKGGAPADPLGRLPWYMEVFYSQVDQFAKGATVPTPTEIEIEHLRAIPETEIKNAFAEIVGEVFVPKDWGGEHSDLLSTQLSIEGCQFATAFAFKGPAKFKPLNVADLGKNGDQISRLFGEPADFVVLQHCHSITTAVRSHMRAFATQFHQLRLFCLIDGADTVRILKAHTKLGY